jgi:hypothetical protein
VADCRALLRAPSRQTIRRALHGRLPTREDLTRRLNRALALEVPRVWRKRRQQVSMDLTLIPYHGLPLLDELEIYRSQAKSCTSHFHADATAYVNYRGQRYTLALTPVCRGEKMQDVIRRLLKRLTQLGVRVRMLLLDRGFWSVAVIRYLQRARRSFLMPVLLRGRKEGHPKGPSGTRVFALRKRGGWDEYTLCWADGQAGRVSVCIHCPGRWRWGWLRGQGREVWAHGWALVASLHRCRAMRAMRCNAGRPGWVQPCKDATGRTTCRTTALIVRSSTSTGQGRSARGRRMSCATDPPLEGWTVAAGLAR